MERASKTAFERVQTARHLERPYTLDIIKTIFSDYVELHGDRRYSDDPALISGFANFKGIEVAVLGQQKGRDINERRYRNFAMSKPEGYRKALRIMQLAEKFERPIITFIDTSGAYPGIDAEERGQAEAIAYNLKVMASLKVPTIAVVVGEGGSGGALAIGVADRVLMMENAVYSVITPEGCAAILWKDAGQAPLAATSLKVTAGDLVDLELVDEVIAENQEWNYIEKVEIADNKAQDKIYQDLEKAIHRNLKELLAMSDVKRREKRYQKFRKMGKFQLT